MVITGALPHKMDNCNLTVDDDNCTWSGFYTIGHLLGILGGVVISLIVALIRVFAEFKHIRCAMWAKIEYNGWQRFFQTEVEGYQEALEEHQELANSIAQLQERNSDPAPPKNKSWYEKHCGSYRKMFLYCCNPAMLVLFCAVSALIHFSVFLSGPGTYASPLLMVCTLYESEAECNKQTWPNSWNSAKTLNFDDYPWTCKWDENAPAAADTISSFASGIGHACVDVACIDIEVLNNLYAPF